MHPIIYESLIVFIYLLIAVPLFGLFRFACKVSLNIIKLVLLAVFSWKQFKEEFRKPVKRKVIQTHFKGIPLRSEEIC